MKQKIFNAIVIVTFLLVLAEGYYVFRACVAINATIDVVTENYLRNIVQDQKDLEQDEVIKKALGVDHEQREKELFRAFEPQSELMH